jgi:hypothetical protein
MHLPACQAIGSIWLLWPRSISTEICWARRNQSPVIRVLAVRLRTAGHEELQPIMLQQTDENAQSQLSGDQNGDYVNSIKARSKLPASSDCAGCEPIVTAPDADCGLP